MTTADPAFVEDLQHLIDDAKALKVAEDQFTASEAAAGQLRMQVANLTTSLAEEKAKHSGDVGTLTSQLSQARLELADVEEELAAAQARILELTGSVPKSTLWGFWPGGSQSTPVDEDGDKDVDWFDDYTRVMKYLGRPDILRDFPTGSGIANIPATFIGGRAHTLGLKAVVQSFTKPTIADWMTGGGIDRLAKMLLTVPDDVDFFYCPHHEPYPEWDTAAQAKLYKAVIDAMPKKPNLHPTYIPMGFDWQSGRMTEAAFADAGFEVLAPDLYLTHGTLDDIFVIPHNIAVKHGLRFGVSEVSKGPGFKLPGRTEEQTALDLVNYLNDTVAKQWKSAYITWFESNKSDGNWLILNYPTAAKALRDAIAA